MTRLPSNGGSIAVPCLHIPFAEEFEVCWAGASPMAGGLCFGSTEGNVLFTDEDGQAMWGFEKGTESREAINGVVSAGDWAVVSSRADVNFWHLEKSKRGKSEGIVIPYGAHGIGATASGAVIASIGRRGVMVIEAPFGPKMSVTALGDGSMYAYRVIGLVSESGKDVLACAARTKGIAAGEYSGPQTTTMRSATPDRFDAIDICPLESGRKSLAVAVLGRDGSIVLFRDVLSDNKPITVKFKRVAGVAYRLLSHGGELYVLTSKAIYVLGKLVARFLAGELSSRVVTQILSVPIDAIDVNLALDRWLLAVLPDEVRRFDTVWIHENVPEDDSEGGAEDFESAMVDQQWRWHSAQLAAS
jgi:hypothetical protein